METTIKANICYWMSFYGMSHKQAAAIIGVSSSTLYKRLRSPESFTIEEIKRFAAEIGVDAPDLVVTKMGSKKKQRSEKSRSSAASKCSHCEFEKPLGGCTKERCVKKIRKKGKE